MANPDLKKLMEALDLAPRQIIQGVLHPSGVAAGRFPGDEFWHMMFSFVAWRVADGPLQKTRLVVRKDIEDGQLDAYQKRLADYDVATLEVGLLQISDFPGPQALLHRILLKQRVSDDLIQLADDLRKPVTTERSKKEMTIIKKESNNSLFMNSTFFNRRIGVLLDEEGIDDYAEACAAHFNSLPPSLESRICEAILRYCHDFEYMVGREKRNIENPHDILGAVTDGCLIVPKPQSATPIVHIEANCDWDIEHGLEILIRGEDLLYVGGFNSEAPYGDFTEKDSWNYA